MSEARDLYDEIFEEMRAAGEDHLDATDAARRRTLAATGVDVVVVDDTNPLNLDFGA